MLLWFNAVKGLIYKDFIPKILDSNSTWFVAANLSKELNYLAFSVKLFWAQTYTSTETSIHIICP